MRPFLLLCGRGWMIILPVTSRIPKNCLLLLPARTSGKLSPYGETMTYGDLAARIGCASARAVGGAVGKNPISIIVPCHRVVGSDGALTGYAGGISRKEWLLCHEGIKIEKSKCPARTVIFERISRTN